MSERPEDEEALEQARAMLGASTAKRSTSLAEAVEPVDDPNPTSDSPNVVQTYPYAVHRPRRDVSTQPGWRWWVPVLLATVIALAVLRIAFTDRQVVVQAAADPIPATTAVPSTTAAPTTTTTTVPEPATVTVRAQIHPAPTSQLVELGFPGLIGQGKKATVPDKLGFAVEPDTDRSYQWEVCNPDCAAVDGATETTWKLPAKTKGEIRVKITAIPKGEENPVIAWSKRLKIHS